MTDYSKMTDEELRLAIARIKGGSMWFRDGAPSAPLITAQLTVPVSWLELPMTRVIGNESWDFPNWPADIAAAWELVEEIRKTGDEVYLNARKENYLVHIVGTAEIDNIEYIVDERAISVADNAPRAICLAYLVWKAV